MKVTKAIITAAGRGTRFLPLTKVVPKELLPIGNRPTIHYLLEECQRSGINEVAIVVREWGSLTEQYFTRDWELEEFLRAKGKLDLLKLIQEPALGMRLTFIKQREDLPMGHGSPVLSAKNWVSQDNFALLFCDDLVKSETPGVAQLLQSWEANPTLSGVVMTDTVPWEQISSFSSVKFREDLGAAGVRFVEDYIEKPKTREQAFSNELFIGRAVYGAEIMNHLEANMSSHRDNQGEFSVWDAMMTLGKEKPFGALKVDGRWLTTGTPEQMWETSKILLGEG